MSTVSPAAPGPEGEQEFLERYDPAAYPPVAVTVDIALLTLRQGRLSVLLVERGRPPFKGDWALPGGFVQPDETLDEGARRELAEETGVSVSELESGDAGHLEQLRTYGDPDRDPRMRVVSAAYLAMMAEVPTPVAGTDAVTARFWATDDLALVDDRGDDAPRLAFDHRRIVLDAIERARAKLEYTTLATAFVDETFTLGELRRVYEAVWGVPLHAGNFRRKVLGTPDFVEPTGTTTPTRGRPAELYRRAEARRLHPPILRPGTD